MTILLKDLAERAKKDNWIITNEEAIDIWLIIPEGCERTKYGTQIFIGDDEEVEEYLLIKGLGEFKIE